VTRHNISASTFIRNTLEGAFCLFESMASFLPFVDDMTIVDLGSTDGTLQILEEIARANPRVRVVNSRFSRIDAGAFADVANECVGHWKHEHGLFWQADEIWHQDLLSIMDEKLSRGMFDMIFWRYQLKENFQVMKWPPHPIHRVGTKGMFHFVDDGMNTDRTWDAKICSSWDMGWFIKWGDEFKHNYPTLPTNQMVLDVSAIGGFLENIVRKRTLHAPMWHEKPNIDGEPVGRWYARERNNPNWNKTETPFNIPHIMRWHVSRPTYDLRAALLDALKADNTKEIIGYV
jgi:glycosyltransferase involved in cell wall biosynthesis